MPPKDKRSPINHRRGFSHDELPAKVPPARPHKQKTVDEYTTIAMLMGGEYDAFYHFIYVRDEEANWIAFTYYHPDTLSELSQREINNIFRMKK